MRDEWVAVAAFDNAVDAELVKGRLAAEGIEAVVFDPQSATGAAGIGAVGGVQVQVWREDAERARRILATE